VNEAQYGACTDLVVPLVDLAVGVDTEDGRVGRVDEGLELLCNRKRYDSEVRFEFGE
jgi:hypothetical protein